METLKTILGYLVIADIILLFIKAILLIFKRKKVNRLRDNTIRDFIAERFPEEWAITQIKEGVTFKQAKSAIRNGNFRETICSDCSMDTALRRKIWVGFKECFRMKPKKLEKLYFSSVRRTEMNLPFAKQK